MNNAELYESDAVIEKYAANNTRLNSLNIPEKTVIDRFLLKPCKILEVGCGAGRLAVNLYLYGHDVKGVDLSLGMVEQAKKKFSPERFSRLVFENDNAIDLQGQKNGSYDVVFITMNGIDYIENIEDRGRAIKSALRVLKDDGLFIFSSHNHKAYPFTYKDICATPVLKRIRTLSSGDFLKDMVQETEEVVGGGNIWKFSPSAVIAQTEVLGFEFLDFAVDARTRIDNRAARSLKLSQYIFDYILYVFRKIK